MLPSVGAGLDRVDGRHKVTGGARYAAEHNLENMAYGVLVMSTIPSGTIRSIDDSAAKKSPGVLVAAAVWAAVAEAGETLRRMGVGAPSHQLYSTCNAGAVPGV